MTKQRPTPRVIESIKDFHNDHPVIGFIGIGGAGALSALAVLASINAYAQPQAWKDSIVQAVRDDGFTNAEYTILPNMFDRDTAKTVLTYEGCAIEGVTISLVYQNDQLTDITSYDLSTAERAVEMGILPHTTGPVMKANELAGVVALSECPD